MSNARRKLGIESLEQRRLLAVIDWDGGGDGKTWHDAANWVGDIIPGSSDSARIAATFPRVEIRQTIDVLGVEALSGLSVFDSQVILRGNTQIDNGLVLSGQSRLDVTNAATVNVTGASNINNASVFVSGASSLVLPIASYSRDDSHSPSTGWPRYFHVQDAGSTLSLPNLTEVAGRTEDSRGIIFEAHLGAQLLLPSLNKSDTAWSTSMLMVLAV